MLYLRLEYDPLNTPSVAGLIVTGPVLATIGMISVGHKIDYEYALYHEGRGDLGLRAVTAFQHNYLKIIIFKGAMFGV